MSCNVEDGEERRKGGGRQILVSGENAKTSSCTRTPRGDLAQTRGRQIMPGIARPNCLWECIHARGLIGRFGALCGCGFMVRDLAVAFWEGVFLCY